MIRHRAIVVVHGVGSQKKGETLFDVIEPIARYLRRYLNRDDPHVVALEVDLRPDHGPARAQLRFDHAGDQEIWTVTEAWWAEAFYTAPSDPVLIWGWRILLRQAANIVFGVLGRRLPFLPKGTYRPSVYPYEDVKTRPGSRLYDAFLGLVSLAFFLAAYILALALATLFFLIAQLPSWLLVVGPAAQLQQWLVGTLVAGPGDQYAMSKDHLARASASRTVMTALAPHLDNRDTGYQYCETATVIAHSGGCVVSYVTLSDEEVKAWSFGEAEGRAATRVTWFTVGSGLNLAFRENRSDPLWKREIDHRVKWIDLWARHDPVPHGQADREMQQLIRAEGSNETVAPFVNQRVVNRDNPFRDHGEYWRNYEEVVSRFVFEILSGPAQDTVLGAAIQTSIGEIPQHRTAVATNFVVARVIAALLVGLGWGSGVAAHWGAWLVAALRSIPLPWPLDGILAWLAINAAMGPIDADILVGLGVLGILAYFAYRLYALILRGVLERGGDWG